MNQLDSDITYTKYNLKGDITHREIIPKDYINSQEHKRKVEAVLRSDKAKKHPTAQEQRLYELLAELLKKCMSSTFIKCPCTQVPIFINKTDYYIVDIYFEDLKIAVEVDGIHHGKKLHAKYDRSRDKHLSELGIKTIRVWNHQVKNYPYKTAMSIIKQIDDLNTL